LHYVENTKEWFVAWARNITELVLMIDGIVGEPDQNSPKQLTAPGFANYHINFSNEGYHSVTIVKDENLRENLLHVEGSIGREETWHFEIIDWLEPDWVFNC
jgi:hypothetical protein